MTQGHPSAAELIEAVAEFLADEVTPQLEPAAAFKLRVALNALAIVARHLALGPALAEQECRALAGLLDQQADAETLNAALCAAIRDRQLTWRDNALLDMLMPIALGKLAVDNPKYATYRALVQNT